MKDKVIYIKPLQEYTTVSVSNRIYTFVPNEIYRYYPEYGTIETCYGQIYLGMDYEKFFRKVSLFERILNFIF